MSVHLHRIKTFKSNFINKVMNIVEKIHREVDTAQDRLLNEALMLISMNEVSEEMRKKAERLEKVGFVNNPLVKTISDKNNSLVKTTSQADLIKHYKDSYPTLKFLTVKEFDRICSKYKLIYAPIKNYIKDIPEKNLADIETMPDLKYSDSLKNNHFLKVREDIVISGLTTEELKEVKEGLTIIINESFICNEGNSSILSKYFNKQVRCQYEYIRELNKIDQSGLFIAAPKSHFDLTDLKKNGKGFFNMIRIEPKDPIVFRYVDGGIQVITKWGDEANDPNLMIF